MTKFLQALLDEWRRLELPLQNARVVVAVSGGADSTALLLALAELIRAKQLALKLTVAHLDHGLRGKASKEDAEWVTKLGERLGYQTLSSRVDVKKRAGKTDDNLEQAARRARYDFLAKVARKQKAQMILVAHTMDDQAETVVLNLLRGSGVDGLGGIEPVRLLDSKHRIILARPLLRWARRADTESYCRERDVDFRTDQMNLDEKFARVRVRRRLLPLMATFNSRVVEALSRTALLLREDAAALAVVADELLARAGENSSVDGSVAKRPPASDGKNAKNAKNKVAALRVEVLANAQPAVRLRALRQWIARGRGDLRRLELVHVLAVEQLLVGNRGGRLVELPGGARIARRRGKLEFRPE
ncbi:MAG: tRNA lysidine(34) synthetase TilS [Pyrinomonadaceae bacterium]